MKNYAKCYAPIHKIKADKMTRTDKKIQEIKATRMYAYANPAYSQPTSKSRRIAQKRIELSLNRRFDKYLKEDI